MRRFIVAIVVAVAGGLLMALSFPPAGALRPLAVAGPLLLALSVRGLRARTAYLVAFVFGMAFFVPHIAWAGEFLGWLPWTALAVYQSVFVGFLGPALVAIFRLRVWPVWAACAWVGMEALRSRYLFGGFPWGRLGFSQDAGPFTPWVAYGGIPLLSAMVALCGFLLAEAWIRAQAGFRSTRRPNWRTTFTRPVLVVAGCALLIPLLGSLGWLTINSGSDSKVPTTVVAVIQGNVPREGLEFNAQRRAVLDNHVKETFKLAADIDSGKSPQPTVVLWPENSSDIDPFVNEDASTEIQAAADAVNAPILVGAVANGPGDHPLNMAVMWWPSNAAKPGPGQKYVKRHPAPFAEYIPYRSFFRKITPMVDEVRADFLAGKRVGTFNIARDGAKPFVLGDVICFEVAYDGLVADTVRDGAKILTVQTNNATFGHTNEAAQQFAMSRLRAIEFDRTVLSASTSGISGIILPDGTVIDKSGLYEPAKYVGTVPLMSTTTVAAWVGPWPEYLMCVAALCGIVIGFLRRPRTRRRSREKSADPVEMTAADAVVT
ncbi:apolipoprotein N-acyltransferase [Antricoccus suffuscus]|uniref:apolipoprotein N-acyltransferase n=1 Tax=Antricoccus suffuscus TaxID=1629062 RepID=UPI001473DB6A|nr:apolipoprotein N-acyltransferase [Antricoccus suffuscus]